MKCVCSGALRTYSAGFRNCFSLLESLDHIEIERVADIQLSSEPPYRVVALLYGQRGWLHRLHVLNPFTARFTTTAKPDTVFWHAVECIDRKRIFLRVVEGSPQE